MKDYIADVVKSVESAELGNESTVKHWADTGNYALNEAISGSFDRGFPFQRVVELFGDPSTGKSLIIYHLLADVQKRGGVAILDDTEDSYTPEFGKQIGIDNNELIKLSSLTVEEHFEKIFFGWKDSKGKQRPSIVQMILENEPGCLIVVALDSLALLSTRHEQEVKFEKPDMIKAKQIRAGLRMCSDVVKSNNILHLISNHTIAKIGVMYGPKKTTPGGSGVPFQASVRIDLSLRAKIKEGDTDKVIGVNSEACVVKNKVGAPFRKALLEIEFAKGLIQESGLYESLLAKGLISEGDDVKKGFFKYGENQFRKRKEDFLEFLLAHPEIIASPSIEEPKKAKKKTE
jgi:recombination protein RecA